MPVAASSPPTQSTPSKEACFTVHMASMIVIWSLDPSATKSGYWMVFHLSMYVEPTCSGDNKNDGVAVKSSRALRLRGFSTLKGKATLC